MGRDEQVDQPEEGTFGRFLEDLEGIGAEKKRLDRDNKRSSLCSHALTLHRWDVTPEQERIKCCEALTKELGGEWSPGSLGVELAFAKLAEKRDGYDDEERREIDAQLERLKGLENQRKSILAELLNSPQAEETQSELRPASSSELSASSTETPPDPDRAREALALFASLKEELELLKKSFERRKRPQEECRLLAFCSTDAWKQLVLNGEGQEEDQDGLREYPPGRTLIRQGEFTQFFWVLLRGEVEVMRALPDAEAGTGEGPPEMRFKAVMRHPPRDENDRKEAYWFGEMSSLANQPANAYIVVREQSQLLRMPPALLRKFRDDGRFRLFKELLNEQYKRRALIVELRNVPELFGPKIKDSEEFALDCEIVELEPGQCLARPGDSADALYLVREGCLWSKLEEEDEAPHEILKPRSSLGYASLLREPDERVWGRYVAAREFSTIVRIPREHLKSSLAGGEDAWEQIEDEAVKSRARLERTYVETERFDRMRALDNGEYIKADEGLVIDLNRCTRCNACVETCASTHADGIPRISKVGLQSHAPSLQLITACYHCVVPECMSACGDGAIRRRRSGLIDFIWDNCTGCERCAKECPFDVIRIMDLDLARNYTARSRFPGERLVSRLEEGVRSLVGQGEAPQPHCTNALGDLWQSWFGAQPPDYSGGPSGFNNRENRLGQKAVQCDGCYGQEHQACVWHCPCDAIHRGTPAQGLGLYESEGVVYVQPEEQKSAGEGANS